MSVASGSAVVAGDFDVLKVFSATKHQERARIGEEVTEYKRRLAKEGAQVIATAISQSSDSEFHCLTISVFSKNKL